MNFLQYQHVDFLLSLKNKIEHISGSYLLLRRLTMCEMAEILFKLLILTAAYMIDAVKTLVKHKCSYLCEK